MTPSQPQQALSGLVRAAISGDERACRTLFETHVDAVFRFLRQFSSSPDDIDEWVQRAFIRAFDRLNTFDVSLRFEPWLFQIALNEMRMDKRRGKILPFVAPQEDPVEAQFSEQFEWTLTMKAALASLDDTKRAVFVLYEVEGFSHQEIGSMLDISESHSRTILARTKGNLRSMLHDERNAV